MAIVPMAGRAIDRTGENSMITLEKCPPADLLEQAISTGNLDDLEEWFIQTKNPGYSFKTIADFVEERRSAKPPDGDLFSDFPEDPPKTKRAPSAKTKTRKTPKQDAL
jgi:hypothetical protein